MRRLEWRDWLVTWTLVATLGCGGSNAPALMGSSCDAKTACGEGLTCADGVCVSVSVGDGTGDGAGDDKGTGDGKFGGSDAGGQSGKDLDAGTGNDAGHVDPELPADAGTCPPCKSPPTPCHARVGTCVHGACEYAFVEDALCDDGNPCTLADTCTNGRCAGSPMICDEPPPNVCTGATQLKSFDQTGSCQGGLCQYPSRTVSCTNGGCEQGACVTDPCATMTCNTPPGICFTQAGVCQGGSCSYPFNNGAGCNDGNSCTDSDLCNSGVCQGTPKSCRAPPANRCENSSTLRAYASVGTCNGGQCSYSYGFVSCANGCANAQCNSSGWTVMHSNVTVQLNAVWGSSASAVWAAGQGGTLVYFNGAQWQARPSGINWVISQLHGTAADNVFALAGPTLLHYNGMSWSIVPQSAPLANPHSIVAIGPQDVLIQGRAGSTTDELLRVRNVNGTWQTTLLHGLRSPSGLYRMWPVSATSVYLPGGNHWDGTRATPLGSPTYAGRGPGKLFAAGSLVLGLDWQNGATPLFRYDATGAVWTPMATGFSGILQDIGGTSDSRVFLVGYDLVNDVVVGHVLHFDGVGWTDLQLPAGVGNMRAVWAVPSGEVFAVGDRGLILRGP